MWSLRAIIGLPLNRPSHLPSNEVARRLLPPKVYRGAQRALDENNSPTEVRMESCTTGALVEIWLPDRDFKHGSLDTPALSHDAWIELAEVVGWIMSLRPGQADEIKMLFKQAEARVKKLFGQVSDPMRLVLTVERLEGYTQLVRVSRREGLGGPPSEVKLVELARTTLS